MTYAQGYAAPSGALGLKVIRNNGRVEHPHSAYPARELPLADIARFGLPARGQSPLVNDWRRANRKHLARGLRRVLPARALRMPHFYGQLFLTVFRADGTVDEFGLASLRVVTTVGVNFLVDALQGTVEPEILKFHAIGTGSTAEATSDTALVAESTTALNPDSTRATGSLTEGATANVFRTVGTLTADAQIVTREHGIFSASSAGTLLDRSVFAAVTLESGDSIQTTYDLTIAAGS